MSWYRVYEIDVLRVGQLFLQQNIDSIYPSAGTVLYTDGSGGTFWSTAGGGGGGGDPSPSSALTQLQLVSTVDGLGQIYTSTSAAGVTGDQLYSTVRNLGTAGYISSAQLTSTVRNLGTAGYISSAQLQSTVRNLGTAGYISSSQLTSTVTGLSGSAGGQGVSSLFGVVSSGLSTIALFTSNTSNYFLPALSNNYSTNLQSTVEGLGTAGYISSSQLFSTVSGIGTGGGGLSPSQLISTTEGLGTAGYISTSQLFSTVAGIGTGGGGGLSPSQLFSTTEGLGTAGYISTSQLFSTVAGIGTGGGGLTPNQLISTTEGLGTAGYVSTSQLAAYVSTQIQLNPSGTYGELFYLNYSITTGTYQALQTSVTTASLQTVITNINGNVIDDLVAGFQTTSTLPSFIPPGFWTITLFSQASGLGLSMYAALYSRTSGGSETLIASNTPKVVPTSFTQWQSFLSVPYTNIPAGDGVLLKIFVNNAQSSPRSLSNYFEANLYSYVNTTFGTIVPDAGLTSTVRGLGTAGYISAPQLYSTLNTALASTTQGLGTAGYISTSQLFSTVFGQQSTLTTALASTAQGLGTLGYISAPQLFSTVSGQQSAITSTAIGLGTFGYISGPQLYSTINTALASTTNGLGTAGYISASQLYSTIASQQSSLATALASTTEGLGTAGYISSTQLISTTKGLQDYISTVVTTPGNTTGTVVYLNYSVTASPYKALESVTTTAATTNLPTTVPGNTSNVPVAQFQTDFSLPTFIPAGIWDLNLFAYANDINHVFVYASLYSRNGGGAETLIVRSVNEPIITTVQDQYVITLTVPYTPILANTTLVLKLFANNTRNQTDTLNTLYEGASYTHMHTTFGTIIPAEVFASTVAGLGTAGYISTSQLFSTVAGIGTGGGITATDLTSTSIGLATFGYISTSQLFSTVEGISAAGGGGGLTTTQLTSTVNGLGTAGYISTPSQGSSGGTSGELFYMNYSVPNGIYKSLEITTTTAPLQTVVTNINGNVNNQLVAGFQTDFTLPSFILAGFWTITLFLEASSIGITMYAALYSRTSGGVETLIASNLPVVVQTFLTETQFYIPVTYTTISPGTSLVLKIFANNTQSSTQSITTYFEATLYSYVNTTIGSIIPEAGLTSTVRGLGTAGYISSSQLYSTINTSLASTTRGLATTGYISSSQLYSTINTTVASTTQGLGNLGYISGPQLFSTVFGQESTLTRALTSTTIGLGTIGYISSTQLYSTINTSLASTTRGLGTAGYISTTQLFSTVFAQQSTLVRSLTSTVAGLGTASYISAPQVLSTVAGLGTAGYISAPQLLSTVRGQSASLISTVDGLGRAGYISSSQLISSMTGQEFLLISTTGGLGTAGYISASQLYSTVTGIDANGIGGGITSIQLLSTTRGLGTAGYISSSQLISTVEGINIAGIGDAITKTQLQSTTAGLGTASYVSTSTIYAMVGTEVRFPPIKLQSILIQDWSTPVSTVALFTSNTSNYYKNTMINFSTPLFSTVAGLGTTGYASTTLVYFPNISTQAVLPFPTIGINPLSTVSAAFGTFSTLTTTNTFIGNSLYFYGLNGTYDGTVLAERLISTQTQEFFIFKGSNAGENIRLQASGNITFETGATPRPYLNAITQSTPTLLITPSRTVGINCNAPAYTLDISGSANITGAASVGGGASITGTTTVSGILTSRVRVVAPTITTNQTLLPSDTSTYFFYTTFSPSLSINVPSPATAGSGWTVTIQNAPASLQVIFVQTTPVKILSSGDTVRVFTDGLSWYFI